MTIIFAIFPIKKFHPHNKLVSKSSIKRYSEVIIITTQNRRVFDLFLSTRKKTIWEPLCSKESGSATPPPAKQDAVQTATEASRQEPPSQILTNGFNYGDHHSLINWRRCPGYVRFFRNFSPFNLLDFCIILFFLFVLLFLTNINISVKSASCLN